MYGETLPPPAGDAGAWGLSPHVRGNRRGRTGPNGAAGSIPACTGKPPQRIPRPGQSAVYPRMYGETAGALQVPGYNLGLSPHVRGNPPVAFAFGPDVGSIPACTGKPAYIGLSRRIPAVYPRMYGETHVFRRLHHHLQGLSPHVRGNPTARHRYPQPDGSIPACTGKPRTFRRLRIIGGVYPRMYGETRGAGGLVWSVGGLSPHVRGNQQTPKPAEKLQRSIPACTGKPSKEGTRRLSCRVYPRMYGETAGRGTRPPCT